MKKNLQEEELSALRRKAKTELRKKTRKLRVPLPQDTRTLIDELQTRQVELEMQNEELREARQDLEQSQRNYADLYDFAPIGYFVVDRCGTIQSTNLAGGQLLGKDRHDVLGLPFSVFVLKEDWRIFFAHLAEAFQRRLKQTRELRLVAGDGSTVDVQLQSIVADQADAGPVLCRMAVIDLSDRRRAGESGRQLADELAVMTRLHEIGTRFAGEGDPDSLLQTVLDGAMEIAGATMGTLQTCDAATQSLKIVAHCGLGQPFLDHFATVHQRQPAVGGNVLLMGERVIVDDVQASPLLAGSRDLEVLRAAGVRAVQTTPLLSRSGRLVGFLATHWPVPYHPDQRLLQRIDLLARQAADFIERTSAEQSLRQAKAAAETANEAKSRFLANISHELRTPMNAILGMIDLTLQKQTDPEGKDLLQTAKESADLLLALLDDLLDCVKIECGKLTLESAPFSLRHVLDQFTRVLTLRAAEKGISFACRIPDRVPDALIGDQVRLRQILLNLAGNGIKFTERGAVTVTVEVESQTKQDACLEFTVEDTGIGIAPGDVDRLFQPFTQADSSTTRRFGGTGLGLAIVSSLVAMMRGRLSVQSEPEQGSRFCFTLRMSLAPQGIPQPKLPEVSLVARSSLRILVVEDTRANQKLASHILRQRGHRVDLASDGQEGLRLARENPYDVILMDVQMPVMDGLEATKAIRASEDNPRRVPIVAMTAHAMQGDRERCLAAGMNDYLSKPIVAREMVALVERLAERPPPGPG